MSVGFQFGCCCSSDCVPSPGWKYLLVGDFDQAGKLTGLAGIVVWSPSRGYERFTGGFSGGNPYCCEVREDTDPSSVAYHPEIYVGGDFTHAKDCPGDEWDPHSRLARWIPGIGWESPVPPTNWSPPGVGRINSIACVSGGVLPNLNDVLDPRIYVAGRDLLSESGLNFTILGFKTWDEQTSSADFRIAGNTVSYQGLSVPEIFSVSSVDSYFPTDFEDVPIRSRVSFVAGGDFLGVTEPGFVPSVHRNLAYGIAIEWLDVFVPFILREDDQQSWVPVNVGASPGVTGGSVYSVVHRFDGGGLGIETVFLGGDFTNAFGSARRGLAGVGLTQVYNGFFNNAWQPIAGLPEITSGAVHGLHFDDTAGLVAVGSFDSLHPSGAACKGILWVRLDSVPIPTYGQWGQGIDTQSSGGVLRCASSKAGFLPSAFGGFFDTDGLGDPIGPAFCISESFGGTLLTPVGGGLRRADGSPGIVNCIRPVYFPAS